MVRAMNTTVACQPMYGLAVLPKYEVRVRTDPPEIIPSEYGTFLLLEDQTDSFYMIVVSYQEQELGRLRRTEE